MPYMLWQIQKFKMDNIFSWDFLKILGPISGTTATIISLFVLIGGGGWYLQCIGKVGKLSGGVAENMVAFVTPQLLRLHLIFLKFSSFDIVSVSLRIGCKNLLNLY